MLNILLFFDVVFVSIISSFLAIVLIQTIKENYPIKSSKQCVLLSIIISFLIGLFFSLTFSTLDLLLSIWSGIFCFAITNSLYKIFENKLFKSFKYIKKLKEENDSIN